MQFRIGEGWDIHALVEGRKLVLGGVEIPFHKGLLGHSDADALLHAITDALLGAAALGDIGTLFPDTDAQFKGADSALLLTETARQVRAKGYEVGNVDCTVIAQAPKLAPYKQAMRARIAQILDIPVDKVNVKAKTAEKMGPVGEGLAMEARAVRVIFREEIDGSRKNQRPLRSAATTLIPFFKPSFSTTDPVAETVRLLRGGIAIPERMLGAAFSPLSPSPVIARPLRSRGEALSIRTW